MEETQRYGSLIFAVNGERFELLSVDPSTTLLQFLRNETSFKSPKLGCGEGGCGACVVLLSKYNPKLKRVEDCSVSSCLTLLCSLNGCSVTTSEGLGNTNNGFHSIHERFAGFHASQCGYCTPGMSMSFFSALVNADKKSNQTESKPGFSKLTSSEAEKAVAGNLCRCTGYRPIADACKTFASDVDIEDLGLNSFWKKDDPTDTKASKLPPYDPNFTTFPQFLKSESATSLDSTRYPWYTPLSINELRSLLNSYLTENDTSVKLVVGNTGTGYYKETCQYDRYIDLRYIPELSIIKSDHIGIEVGATVTISNLISFLKEGNEINPSSYVKLITRKLAQHIEKIATPFVRNSASIGGNLVMAQKNSFPSDLSTLFLCLGATVCIMTSQGREKITWEEVLSRPPLDSRSVLLSVLIPFKKGAGFLFETYRASPRPLGNALAYVNAAFLADVSVSPDEHGILINDIRLAFGAYGTKHATIAIKVEEYVKKRILNINVLSEAVKLVKKAVVPEDGTSHPDYRSSLAVGFLFEFLYGLLNGSTFVEKVSKSEEQTLLSSAKQVVESTKEYYPVGEPMKKFGASMQASGEAVYVDDIPSPPKCLHGAFIYSTRPLAIVKKIHFGSDSLPDGVTAVITSKDIPSKGANVGCKAVFGLEPLFADDLTQCAGDPIAFVVAESQRSADVAASTAIVEYNTENVGSPILTVEEAVQKSSFFQAPPSLYPKKVGDFSKGMAQADHKILCAEIRLGSQYYFYMETQTAVAVPDEDNCMVVYASSQCPEHAGSVIASCLGVPEHNIRVVTRRVGGGYGGKGMRAMPVSTACALAAFKLRRPVRIYVNRKTDMIMMGGRHPMKITYSVGFKSNGKITALHLDLLINAGMTEDFSPLIPTSFIGALKKYNWGALSFDIKVCKTNLTSKSAMRGPGEVQGSYIAEAIMEHIASILCLEADAVRKQNIHTVESLELFYEHIDIGAYTLPRIMDELAASSSLVQRSKMIEQYNRKNIWKKRGISRVPLVYNVTQQPMPGKVSIIPDGSIVVEVGGIEIGQGLWTKVKQMTAYALSLIESSWSEELVEKIRVIQADTLSLVQGGRTAGSTTSESSCEAVRLCCNILVERLTPLKKQIEAEKGSVDWTTLIGQAQTQAVNLAANSYYVPESSAATYLNYGAAVSEVEINILTGETTILQSDIIYDCGQSLNPAVDMGQIEGAFVQGIGFFMVEEHLTNTDGLVISDSTWTYKIPTMDTIPKIFNVKVLNSGHQEKRVLSSKASGEPPLFLAASVHCAARAAIRAARKQLKLWGKLNESDSEFYLDVPATLPVVKTRCGLDYVEKYLESFLDHESYVIL